jgi:hypothetical protein
MFVMLVLAAMTSPGGGKGYARKRARTRERQLEEQERMHGGDHH